MLGQTLEAKKKNLSCGSVFASCIGHPLWNLLRNSQSSASLLVCEILMTGGNVTMAYPVAAESPGFLTALVVPSLYACLTAR